MLFLRQLKRSNSFDWKERQRWREKLGSGDQDSIMGTGTEIGRPPAQGTLDGASARTAPPPAETSSKSAWVTRL